MTPSQRTALVLFLIALLVYAFPLGFNIWVTPFFHIVPSQDVVSASLVPMSVLTRGNFYLDQFRRYIANNYPAQHFAIEVEGHLVSITPVLAGVLAIPFMGYGVGTGWIARTHNVFDLARLAAASLTALAVIVFFFAARQRADRATSTLAAIAFGFGSAVWATASQGLWQHTPSILFQSIAFWFLLRGRTRGAEAIAPAGLFLSLATVARPPVVVIALVFTLFVFLSYRRATLPFILWALPPLGLTLAYNHYVNGSLFVFGYQDELNRFAIPRAETLQGLLFAPSRGLFVFSPFLLLAPIGLWRGWVREKESFYLYLVLASIAYTTIMAAWGSLGGWAYGARMLTDVLPALCLLILPTVEKTRGVYRAGLWFIVVIAVFVHALGIWDYGLRFHSDPANDVWSIVNNAPLYYLKLYAAMIQEWLAN